MHMRQCVWIARHAVTHTYRHSTQLHGYPASWHPPAAPWLVTSSQQVGRGRVHQAAPSRVWAPSPGLHPAVPLQQRLCPARLQLWLRPAHLRLRLRLWLCLPSLPPDPAAQHQQRQAGWSWWAAAGSRPPAEPLAAGWLALAGAPHRARASVAGRAWREGSHRGMGSVAGGACRGGSTGSGGGARRERCRRLLLGGR